MKNRLFQAAGRRAETSAQANAKLWNAFLIRNNLKECENSWLLWRNKYQEFVIVNENALFKILTIGLDFAIFGFVWICAYCTILHQNSCQNPCRNVFFFFSILSFALYYKGK